MNISNTQKKNLKEIKSKYSLIKCLPNYFRDSFVLYIYIIQVYCTSGFNSEYKLKNFKLTL